MEENYSKRNDNHSLIKVSMHEASLLNHIFPLLFSFLFTSFFFFFGKERGEKQNESHFIQKYSNWWES